MLSVFVVALVLQAALSLGLLLSALVARWAGLRVHRLSIGFGRPLLVLSRGQTRWQLGSLPIGGFVQIAGRDGCDAPVAYADPRAFHNRPLAVRLLPSLALPVGVTLFAALLSAVVFVAWGVPGLGYDVRIDGVVPGSPAERAGLREDDVVLAADGRPLTQSERLAAIVQASGTRPLPLTIRRDGALQTIVVTPTLADGVARIGVALGQVEAFTRPPLPIAIARGLAYPVQYQAFVVRALGPMFTGSVRRQASGPVALVQVVRRQRNQLRGALQLGVVLACYVALILCAPFPPYAGGRIVLVLCGWRSRRRKLPEEARDLGELAPPPRRFPLALLLTLVPLGLLALSPLALLDHEPVAAVVTALVCFGLGALALGLGSPRAWVATVNLLLLTVCTGTVTLASAPNRLSALLTMAYFAICLVGLALPSVRPWFGQTCPACQSHGGRPVWSRPRAFGCLRCGSCWTTRSRSW